MPFFIEEDRPMTTAPDKDDIPHYLWKHMDEEQRERLFAMGMTPSSRLVPNEDADGFGPGVKVSSTLSG